MRTLLTLLFVLGSALPSNRILPSSFSTIKSEAPAAHQLKHERRIGRAFKRGSPIGTPIVLGERSWTRDGRIATIVTVNATGTGELSEDKVSSLARFLSSRTTRSQISYTYDARGRVIEELRSSLGVTYKTTCTYDTASHTTHGTHYDGGKISGYRMTLYDADDSVVSVCEFDRNHKLLAADSITFDPQHRRLKETHMEFGTGERLISGDSKSYAYDDSGRLESVVLESGGRTYATQHYSYDGSAGARPTTLLDGQRELRYKYDPDGRLIEEAETYGGKTMGYRRFEYDEYGSLTRENSFNAKEQLVDQITYELAYW